MTQDDIIRMACGYTAVDPRWYELLEPADFIADKETHDVAVIVSVHKQRPIAPDYYRLNFADGSYMDATDNDVSANYRPYVLISRIAAIEQYDQTSLELCKECGWKAIIPGDGCLVCARQKAKPVAWMFDFMADNRDEVIRDWVTQDYADIKRENGFNVRPLYAAPPAVTQKPVAYVDQRIHGWPDCFVMEPDPPHTVPLYAAPRQWAGLTTQDIEDEWERMTGHSIFAGDRSAGRSMFLSPDEVVHYTQAIEAKLKAINT
jgi:hypothetical protein